MFHRGLKLGGMRARLILIPILSEYVDMKYGAAFGAIEMEFFGVRGRLEITPLGTKQEKKKRKEEKKDR